MGAEFFNVKSIGKTAKEAFKKAVEEAQYDYGHAGYTGTIAEKKDFVMLDLPEGMNPYDYIALNHPSIDDKWGPAGCIELSQTPGSDEKEFLFFGWASS